MDYFVDLELLKLMEDNTEEFKKQSLYRSTNLLKKWGSVTRENIIMTQPIPACRGYCKSQQDLLKRIEALGSKFSP